MNESMARIAKKSEGIMKQLEFLTYFLALSPPELDKFRIDRIKQQIEYAVSRTKFYSKKLGISPPQLTHLSDLQKYPLISKEDLRKEGPETALAMPFEDILRYGETTGTTGKAFPSFVDESNWLANNIFLAVRLYDYFSSKDVVVIAVPYELAFVGQDLDRTFELLGSVIIATGALSKVCPWERTLEIIHRLPVTAVVCSPSRLFRFASLAEEWGLNPGKDFKIKKFLCVGEALLPAKAKRISEIWGAQIYSAYGTTETNSLATTCKYGNMHLLEERYYFEVIDPHTGKLLPEGEKGELVLTSLDAAAVPLIRYRTGDMVMMSKNTCTCGLRCSLIRHFGRKDSILRLGDREIPIIEVEDTLFAVGGINYLFCLKQLERGLTVFIELKNSSKTNAQVKDELIEGLFNRGIQLNKEEEDLLSVESAERKMFTDLMDGSLKPGNALIIK